MGRHAVMVCTDNVRVSGAAVSRPLDPLVS